MATATPAPRMARKYSSRLAARATEMASTRTGAPGMRRSRQLPVATTMPASAAAANHMRSESSMAVGMAAEVTSTPMEPLVSDATPTSR